jgi:hypothetical protein
MLRAWATSPEAMGWLSITRLVVTPYGRKIGPMRAKRH